MGVDLASWVDANLAFLASAALLLIPGLIVGALIRLRGLWLAAAAPGISLTILGLASIVLPVVGLNWSFLPVSAFAVVFGVIVVVLFRWVLKARQPGGELKSGARWVPVVAWAAGAIPLGIYTVLGIGSAENISQTFDNIFHLNTIAEITQSGSASPLTVGLLIAPDGGQSFYPDGWHAAVQLVSQLSGADVPQAINAFNLATAMLVWPLGIVVLVRQFAGSSPLALISAGIFSAAFPAAPLVLLHYGVLYPYFLGVALMPLVLALVVNMHGLGLEPRFFGIGSQALLLAGLIPAIALAHPAAMMGVLAFVVPAAVTATFAGWKTLQRRTRGLRLAWLATFGLVGLAMLYKLRPGVVWGPRLSKERAAWETMSLAIGNYGLPLLAAALMIVGLVVCARRFNKTRTALLGMWFVGAVLFFITAGIWNEFLRRPTGVWYSDTPRLAAMYPIVVIPVIVVGVVWLVGKLALKSRHASAISACVLVALLVITHVTAGYDKFVPTMRSSHTSTETAKLLSPDEIDVLRQVRELVPEDAMIAGNPYTGTSLAYAFSDRQVVLPHVFMKLTSDERSLVMEQLKYETPAACEAAADLGVEYVLDFGELEVHGEDHDYPGIENLDNSPAFELVVREGDAALYEFVGCR